MCWSLCLAWSTVTSESSGTNPAERVKNTGDISARLTVFHPNRCAGSFQLSVLLVISCTIFILSFPSVQWLLRRRSFFALQILPYSCLLSQLSTVRLLPSFSQRYESLTIWKAKWYGRQERPFISMSIKMWTSCIKASVQPGFLAHVAVISFHEKRDGLLHQPKWSSLLVIWFVLSMALHTEHSKENRKK